MLSIIANIWIRHSGRNVSASDYTDQTIGLFAFVVWLCKLFTVDTLSPAAKQVASMLTSDVVIVIMILFIIGHLGHHVVGNHNLLL